MLIVLIVLMDSLQEQIKFAIHYIDAYGAFHRAPDRTRIDTGIWGRKY
jgi:hypothetical protein